LTQRLSLRQRFPVHKGVQGFTQIELAITVLVIGVLATIAAPSFQQWQQQRKVDEAVIAVENAIRETQAEAVKRSQNCELRITASSSGASPIVNGNCLIFTSDLNFRDISLQHNRSPIWTITFNSRGENRNPSNSATATFSILGASSSAITPRCIVMAPGIGLHRSGRMRNNECVKS
jgi:prepilin-type N-terminal cleavage/methylation domain-containing protein